MLFDVYDHVLTIFKMYAMIYLRSQMKDIFQLLRIRFAYFYDFIFFDEGKNFLLDEKRKASPDDIIFKNKKLSIGGQYYADY